MRRPLKPFVTEYRGSARRAKDGAKVSLREDDFAPPAKPAPRPVDIFNAQPHADDSYEAAMRAADALFSGASRKPQETQPQDEGVDPRAADEGSLDERKGRILRVIDEKPADDFAAMEAERAPKKRGRKPGSKNKPKVPPVIVEAIASPPVMAAVVPATRFVTPAAPRATGTASRAQRREQRFAWVRKRLRPGEQWKRNLPKILW